MPKFRPGQSGNPAGRPPGSRSRVAAVLDNVAAADAQRIYGVVRDLALGGDLKACELIMSRAWPIPKPGRRVDLDLPPLRVVGDAAAALAALIRAVASGEVSPDDGRALAVLVSAWRASAAGASPPGDYAEGLDFDFRELSDDELRATLETLDRAALAARRRRVGGGDDDSDGSSGRLN